MSKKLYRYFCGFIDCQENWLNEMASKGYRLVKTGRLLYEFEKCESSQYQYCIDFVADKSYSKMLEYKSFLEDMGYSVMTKNINLNYSVGKIKIRPYGKGAGKIATSPGSYNKELLIVEKSNNGKPFELHTTAEDKICYYRPIRNTYLSLSLLMIVLAVWNYISSRSFDMSTIGLLVFVLIFIVPMIAYQRRIIKLEKQKDIQE